MTYFLLLTYFVLLIFQDMKWAEDKDAAQCQQCNQPFSLARRKVVAVLTGTSVISSLYAFFFVFVFFLFLFVCLFVVVVVLFL